MPYIYDDGDNAPMNEEAWQHQRNGGKQEEEIPFTDLPREWEVEPDDRF